jgi:hypothetical protein
MGLGFRVCGNIVKIYCSNVMYWNVLYRECTAFDFFHTELGRLGVGSGEGNQRRYPSTPHKRGLVQDIKSVHAIDTFSFLDALAFTEEKISTCGLRSLWDSQ